MDGETPLKAGERPPVNGRAARVISRSLIGLGILAVGGFGYLLGVRLSASSSSSQGQSQGGFGGPGGFSGGQGTARSGAGRVSGTSGASATGGASTAGGTGSRRRGGSGGSAGGATVVTLTTAKAGQLRAARTTAGTVVPALQSNVAAQASGVVQQILQPAGASVRQGQALVTLSSDTLQAAVQTAQTNLQKARVDLATQTNANTDQRAQLSLQVSSAQAALSTAQQTYAANQKLYAIGGIAQAELNSARSAVDGARATLASAQASLATNERAKTETLASLQLSVEDAQAGLNQARQNLANLTVRAPFAGQISAVSVNQGENVNTGGAVATLVGSGRKVTFNVAPSDAGALKAGTVLPLKVNNQTYQVKLDQNPPAPVNSVVTVSARLLGTPLPETGAVGTVSYTLPVASGVLVPSAAVQADGTQSYVFLDQNGQAKRQNVTVLGQSGDQSALSGLAAGSSILSDPPDGLLDGARVSTQAASATGTSSQGGSFGGRRFRGRGTSGASTGGFSRGGQNGVQPGGTPPEGGAGGPP